MVAGEHNYATRAQAWLKARWARSVTPDRPQSRMGAKDLDRWADGDADAGHRGAVCVDALGVDPETSGRHLRSVTTLADMLLGCPVTLAGRFGSRDGVRMTRRLQRQNREELYRKKRERYAANK